VRASRLVAVLLHLQQRGRSTAPELADLLEVSVRTIYRDVEALQAAGVPLWTEPGPRGGIRLLDGWEASAGGLTADEASALFLAGAPTAAAELGLAAVLTAAQTKMLATLPPELRARATRVRERFHIDAPDWFSPGDAVPCLPTVADAVWTGHRLDLRYGRPDRAVARRVDPLGLVLKAGTWYLVAAHRGSPRTYRVGRMRRATVRDEPVSRPGDFDLATWWAASSRAFDHSLLRTRLRIRIAPARWRELAHLVGVPSADAARASAGPAGADGWCETWLPVESEAVGVAQLIGMGPTVEVLAPDTARHRLGELAAAVAARHRTATSA
jgi:predicted DNA-binding transcriptional regulator YafY